jgi:hypothetical protein
MIYVPRLVKMQETTLEGANAGTTVTTTNLRWDVFGNVLETAQTSGSGADLASLHSINAFASDPSGRFVSRLWRTRQYNTVGALIADTITQFDHAADGMLGTKGLVIRRLALTITDDVVADVYGSAPPDFAALGYHRRADSPGWWITIASYQRTSDDDGVSGSVTGPRGAA